MVVKWIKVGRDSKYPTYAYAGDAGADLFAAKDHVLKPGQRRRVHTGVRVQVPDGYVGFVTPKSGLAFDHGITVLNAPGTIDSGFRDNLEVLLVNLGEKAYTVKKGKAIAQLVLLPVARAEFDRVSKLDESERGHGGWGSTMR